MKSHHLPISLFFSPSLPNCLLPVFEVGHAVLWCFLGQVGSEQYRTLSCYRARAAHVGSIRKQRGMGA